MKASPRRSRPPSGSWDRTRLEDRCGAMCEAVGGCWAAFARVIQSHLGGATRILVGAVLVVTAGIAPPSKSIAAATRPANSGLPDSVLATVGARSITVSEFWRTWRDTHPGTATDTLTPQSVRGFLEVLIDRELIHAAAARERWTWTALDSAAYRTQVDRITLRAALDGALEQARVASGDSLASVAAAGVLARERAMSALAPRFEDSVLERVARAFAAIPRPVSDSSLSAQLRMLEVLPAFDPAERTTAIARTATAGNVTVNDIVTPWARLSAAYRPRIETTGQVRDLAENVLFERWLRNQAAARDYERNPEIARVLVRERELIDVQHLMARYVYATAPPPPGTFERYGREHAAEWSVPPRWSVIRLETADRAAATRLALLLRDPVAAESLVSRAARQGARYRTEIGAARDSALFARAVAAGSGTVLGPDASGAGWTVTRIEALLPARTPEWTEILPQVEQRWYADESARHLADLLARERRRQRVRIGDIDPGPAAARAPDEPDELTEP